LLLLFPAFYLSGCDDPAPTPAAAAFMVAAPFQELYNRFDPRLLGAPITGQCLPGSGAAVQYFENVRLEQTPDGTVQFYPLGQWALSGVRSRIAAPMPADSVSRTFPETGYAIQDEFLRFYEENDGELLLGPPLSEQLDEGDQRVQYFMNGRLEWRPDAPPDQRVRLGTLGRAHFQQSGGSGLQCDVLAIFDPAVLPSEIELSAILGSPILYSTGDEQIVFVTASGPQGRRISGVTIRVTVHYGGETIEVPLGETDQNGVASGSLGHINFEPEQEVRLEITAHNNDGVILGRTFVSFSTWW
jgi:hypothetical protein